MITSYPETLSEHFTFQEGVHSNTAIAKGIRNLPEDDKIVSNMIHTANRMESVRAILEHPITVNSWFRCLVLNRELGSRDTSDHLLGQAVDFVCSEFGNCLAVARKLIANQDILGYKQLILEHTWVHISFDPDPNVIPKLQVLSLLNSGSYAVGLTNSDGKYYV